MNNSKAKVIISQIIQIVQMIFGIIFAFFGFCCIFSNSIGGVLTFGIIGGVLIYFSLKRKKFIKNFKKYVQCLSTDATGSISNLVSITGTSEDVVKNNLEKMINKNFFVNAYIDAEMNCIVFPKTNRISNNINTISSATQQNISQAGNEYVTVTCKNCGGVNKILKNTVSECEFCGSPIKEE